VNDLPHASDTVKMVLFADDSNLLLKGKNPEDIGNLANGELAFGFSNVEGKVVTHIKWFATNFLDF